NVSPLVALPPVIGNATRQLHRCADNASGLAARFVLVITGRRYRYVATWSGAPVDVVNKIPALGFHCRLEEPSRLGKVNHVHSAPASAGRYASAHASASSTASPQVLPW